MEELFLHIYGQWYWLGPLLLVCLGVALIYLVAYIFDDIQDEIENIFR